MNPFLLLSDDKIYEICESLDDKSLSNMVQTSSRSHNLCQEIIDKRKQKILSRCEELTNYFKSVADFFSVKEKDYTDLRRKLEQHWVNQNSSNLKASLITHIYRIESYYPVRMNWKTRKIYISQYDVKKDILTISIDFSKQFENSYIISINPDFNYSIEKGNETDPSMFNNAAPYLEEYMKNCLLLEHFKFIKRQQKWFQEKPWLQIEGKTPKEAVRILKDLDW